MRRTIQLLQDGYLLFSTAPRLGGLILGHIIAGEYSPIRLFLLRIFARYIEVPLLHLTYLVCRGPLRFLLKLRITRLLLAYGIAYPMGHFVDTGKPLPLTELEKLIEGLEGKMAVGPCRCRIGHRACDHPLETDIVIRTGTDVWLEAFPHEYRVIEKKEALDIVRECSRQGMFSMVFRHCMLGGAVNEYVICNCCTDGCVPYIANRTFGQDCYPLVKGDFRATVVPSLCVACGDCSRACPFGARELRNGICQVIDCYGCGLCALTCAKGASQMERVG